MKISYTYVSGDIFHYGHLRLLEEAKKAADYHICGLLSDKLCLNWNGSLIMNYKERAAVLGALRCVDEVVEQSVIDPTKNLKKICKRYPDAKIILFQGHQDWEGMPGTGFVKSIGGEVRKPAYYPRLTRTFIKNELNRARNSTRFDIEGYILGNISFFALNDSTKANTLVSLKPKLKKSFIEKIFVFTKAQWNKSDSKVLVQIRQEFKEKIVVRSSSFIEDGRYSSYAGFFHSELNVDPLNSEQVKMAISKVLTSYSKHEKNSQEDQILVQSQTNEVAVSGVVFTRNIQNSAPYYVINYDVSSKTDSVTSGSAGNKLEILRDVQVEDLSPPWKSLVESVKEIEELLHNLALDIEFAIKESGEVIIFQIRPLAACQKYGDIPDDKIFSTVKGLSQTYAGYSKNSIIDSHYSLSDMSFWNPAEIIGDRPDNLSYSVYRYLIMNNAWNIGIIPLGYRRVDRDLMVRLGNKPYIEVETSFAALLPAELEDSTTEKLIRYYRDKLQKRPELHDKIEFEIVHNCFSPVTDDQLEELKTVLSQDEFEHLRESLIRLTQRVFDSYEETVKNDLKSLKILSERRKRKISGYEKLSIQEKIFLILELLKDTKELGTPQFSRIARLAFIGNQYLQGLVSREVISNSDIDSFVSTIETVASELNNDFSSAISGELPVDVFIERYGHLRPGSYDITKLPYSKNSGYFRLDKQSSNTESVSSAEAQINMEEFRGRIDGFLERFDISISSDSLLRFIEETIRYRESFKFEFTANLSLALEILADVGEQIGFDRKMLSYLSMESLRGVSSSSGVQEILDLWRSQIEGRRLIEGLFSYISMPPLVFGRHDFDVIHSHIIRPNFVSNKVVTGEILDIESLATEDYDLASGRIILLEKADPGYDWIFSKGIGGLITRYGGAASHMAIRCAEFNIPAAIGCGEVTYKDLKTKNVVQLDCVNRTITAIR